MLELDLPAGGAVFKILREMRRRIIFTINSLPFQVSPLIPPVILERGIVKCGFAKHIAAYTGLGCGNNLAGLIRAAFGKIKLIDPFFINRLILHNHPAVPWLFCEPVPAIVRLEPVLPPLCNGGARAASFLVVVCPTPKCILPQF